MAVPVNRGVWWSVLAGTVTVFVVQYLFLVWHGTTTTVAAIVSVGAGLAAVLLTALLIDWARR